MSKILVIGESCKDVFCYGKVERLCPAAPAPVFNSLEIKENGGMAKNVQNNLLSLNNKVDILTNENWENILKTRYVHVDSNHMFIRVDTNDKNYGILEKKFINSIDLSSYDTLVVSDYNKGYLTKELLYEISLLHNLTFLDTKKQLGPWCENFTFIKINSKEYEANKTNLNEKLANNLIVTRGPNGCAYQNKIYPVSKVEIRDTSGAGDTFLSGLVSDYCKSLDIESAIMFANECATKVVQKKGVSEL
mgnify:CR=1 FL=1|tara:strand:+ start:8610 stop:9353 length:744 start_codon:yes stop_codon:yes gene_type:complete